MADRMPDKSDKGSSSNSHVPPPTDPYVTYQTPYPRNPSDEVQNPFIEFRRLADATFSSFFSALPKLLGTEKFRDANIRQSDEEFAKVFDKHARDFERRITEMAQTRAEEAESLRKLVEQELSERIERQKADQQKVEEENRKDEMIRRGFERCPGLQPGAFNTKKEADTELDLYDGLKAYESPFYRSTQESESAQTKGCPWKDEQVDKKCPWNGEDRPKHGWLSGLGWDGRRRAKNIPLWITNQQSPGQKPEKNVEWQEYNDAEMDPFNNDDHVVPWLRLSPYSPMALINDLSWREALGQSASDQRGQILNDMPWDDAFEDLVSVHKTGRLPSLIRRLVYWGGPNQWMSDMAHRGSLGAEWDESVMVAALMCAVDGNRWKGFDGFKESCVHIAGREFGDHRHQEETASDLLDEHIQGSEDREVSLADWIGEVRKAFDPTIVEAQRQIEELAQSVFGEQRPADQTYGARGMSWPSPEEIINALSESEARAKEDEVGDNQHTMMEAEDNPSMKQSSWSSSPASISSRTPVGEDKPETVTSSLTTTTTRTLPDGSIETKKVLKRRFADGREEVSEGIEIKPRQSLQVSDVSTQTAFEAKTNKQEVRPGWFWN